VCTVRIAEPAGEGRAGCIEPRLYAASRRLQRTDKHTNRDLPTKRRTVHFPSATHTVPYNDPVLCNATVERFFALKSFEKMLGSVQLPAEFCSRRRIARPESWMTGHSSIAPGGSPVCPTSLRVADDTPDGDSSCYAVDRGFRARAPHSGNPFAIYTTLAGNSTSTGCS
jgi:hypothetical protein